MKKKIADLLRIIARSLDPPREVRGQAGEDFQFVLCEQGSCLAPPTGDRLTGRVRSRSGVLEVFVDGYGPVVSGDTQELMTLEIWEGRLRLAYWPEQTEHTNGRIIDLEKSRTTRVSEVGGAG